jgi:RND family efflux transporter MFP subunit
MRNTIFLSLSIVVLSGCFATDSSEAKKKEKIPAFPVISLAQNDTTVTSAYVASIQAVKNVEIRSKLGGSLETILVDEGQTVQQGQALFRLNDGMIRIELEKTRANIENLKAEVQTAELDLKRTRLLANKKIVSGTEVELAEARLTGAKAKLKEARAAEAETAMKLSFTTIRAPFSGIINRIPLKPGSFVNEGQLLTSVSDLDAVYAYFDVSEIEYLKYIKGKTSDKSTKYHKAGLQLADGTPYDHPGIIETMEGEIDNSTGSIAFRAKFPNPQRILKHGSSGKIKLSTPVQNALLIPQKAVFEVQDKNFVFVVNADSTVTMKEFVPAMKISQCYLVQSGLKPGDRILYEGIQNVKNGMKIVPQHVKF